MDFDQPSPLLSIPEALDSIEPGYRKFKGEMGDPIRMVIVSPDRRSYIRLFKLNELSVWTYQNGLNQQGLAIRAFMDQFTVEEKRDAKNPAKEASHGRGKRNQKR